jgi:hypothetical protein
MNTIEKVAIGVLSAIISSALLFAETAAYQPESQNTGNPSLEQMVSNSVTALKNVATLKQSPRG